MKAQSKTLAKHLHEWINIKNQKLYHMDFKEYFFKLLNWLKGSGDNSPGGASSKKLTGFWLIVFVATPPVWIWSIWALVHGDWSLLPLILPMILTGGLAALGINSSEKKKGVANAEEIKKDE